VSLENTDTDNTDPFDRIYSRYARQAMRAHFAPPSRERWDAIVLRLILSEDPDRGLRYRRLEDTGPGSLGEDAYELWRKMPTYTPNLTVPADTWPAYEMAQRASMRRLMQSQGLLDRYNATVEAAQRSYIEHQEARKVRASQAQRSVLIMGCAGLALIAIMVLTVLLIIAIKSL
jgi:hypothetical protein